MIVFILSLVAIVLEKKIESTIERALLGVLQVSVTNDAIKNNAKLKITMDVHYHVHY